MGKLVSPVVGLRLAENDIFRSRLIGVVDPVLAAKPHEVNHVSPVREMRHDAFLASFAKLLKDLYGAFYLHQGHVAAKLADGVDL